MAKVFFSYSHKDESLRDELETHLSTLKRQGVIDTWHDRKIEAGSEFGLQISNQLESSHIILLLVSPYFLASDYCYDIELQKSLEMHESRTAVVIPVILHPCDWQSAPFGKLTASPYDGKPVSTYHNQHEAFLEVTTAIRKVADGYNTSSFSVHAESLRSLNEEKNALHIQEADLRGAIDEVRSSYKTVHKNLVDWLAKNNGPLVERIFKNLQVRYGDNKLIERFPTTSKEIRKFKRDISQDIRHFEVCLLEEDTGIIDEPLFMIEFDYELYKEAYEFLYKRIPDSVPQKSKNKMKFYIDYLLDRI